MLWKAIYLGLIFGVVFPTALGIGGNLVVRWLFAVGAGSLVTWLMFGRLPLLS